VKENKKNVTILDERIVDDEVDLAIVDELSYRHILNLHWD